MAKKIKNPYKKRKSLMRQRMEVDAKRESKRFNALMAIRVKHLRERRYYMIGGIFLGIIIGAAIASIIWYYITTLNTTL